MRFYSPPFQILAHARVQELVEKTTLPKEKLVMSGENITILRDGVIAFKEKVDIDGEKVDIDGGKVDIDRGKLDIAAEKVDIPAEKMNINREKVGIAAEKSGIDGEGAIKSVSAALRRTESKRMAVKENDSSPNRKVNVLLLMAGQQVNVRESKPGIIDLFDKRVCTYECESSSDSRGSSCERAEI